MPRRATVTPHLSVEELHARYRQTTDAVERTHWQIVWLIARGHHLPEVAQLVGYTPNWVRMILRRYNAQGPAGLVDRRHTNPGQRPLLTPALRTELAEALSRPAPDGGLWTCRKVADWMAHQLGRPVGEPRGWEALRSLGFSPQRPRPRATSADPAAQAAFKKGGSLPNSPPSTPPTRTPR
jgi:transposase